MRESRRPGKFGRYHGTGHVNGMWRFTPRPMNPDVLTHFDAQGQAHMVDVSAKSETHRVARATGTIRMQPATFALIAQGQAKKGDVIGIARIAAIQGAKKTSELIPLCHPLAITRIAVGNFADALPADVRSSIDATIAALFVMTVGYSRRLWARAYPFSRPIGRRSMS